MREAPNNPPPNPNESGWGPYSSSNDPSRVNLAIMSSPAPHQASTRLQLPRLGVNKLVDCDCRTPSPNQTPDTCIRNNTPSLTSSKQQRLCQPKRAQTQHPQTINTYVPPKPQNGPILKEQHVRPPGNQQKAPAALRSCRSKGRKRRR